MPYRRLCTPLPVSSYANMDYVFGSSMPLSPLLFIVASYDIACQWFTNLAQRMTRWPAEIIPSQGIKVMPLIPKLHEPGHKKKGHELYSFNFAPGVGMTDGECIERIWSSHNALGNATKTQGPGSRHDVLDDHFGFWNWQKYSGMGEHSADWPAYAVLTLTAPGVTLMRRYRSAIRERNIQVEGHRGFTATVPEVLTTKWERMCVAWEAAPHPKKEVKNPYQTSGICKPSFCIHIGWASLIIHLSGMNEAQAQKALAEEEDVRLAAGGTALHATSPSLFITLGLELEESQ